MNSFERVMNRFQGKPVDRIPNLSIVMMFAAKQQGITYGQYCSDYRHLADSAMLCHEKFGFEFCGTIREVGRKFGEYIGIDNYCLIVE